VKLFSKLKETAKTIKREIMTVYFIARDSRTPPFLSWLALGVAAYALSPIDLIPDFIPILGYLDDVILLPLGILLIIKLTPAEIIQTSRDKAKDLSSKPVSKTAMAIIVIIWVSLAIILAFWLSRILRSKM
jgi:uncharacterized membrane protein YkvA (DUF1232 family)